MKWENGKFLWMVTALTISCTDAAHEESECHEDFECFHVGSDLISQSEWRRVSASIFSTAFPNDITFRYLSPMSYHLSLTPCSFLWNLYLKSSNISMSAVIVAVRLMYGAVQNKFKISDRYA